MSAFASSQAMQGEGCQLRASCLPQGWVLAAPAGLHRRRQPAPT